MRKFLSLLLIGSTCFAKSICLNMIVKDEAPVIKRCLESVKPLIDSYVIVDTGSTDGTQTIIQEVMKDIPGKLYERPWVNFGHNRHEAMKLALGQGDYLLFIDADETLALSEGFKLPELTDDVYMSLGKSPGANPDFQRAVLIKNEDSWSWRGVIHEQLRSSRQEIKRRVLTGLKIMADTEDGHRSLDPNKHYKDALLLKKALEDEPENADYVFYMAQSYYNAGHLKLAKEAYAKRATMGGWDEAVFWSYFCVALIAQNLQENDDEITSAFLTAYECRPTRSEPLFFLADHYLVRGRPHTAFLYAEKGRSLAKPNDSGYVVTRIYEYQGVLLYAKCALACGKYKEAEEAFKYVLEHPKTSSQEREQVKNVLRATFPSSRPAVAGFAK